jgi:hypothetical protein
MQRLRVAHLLRELTRALSHTNLRLMRFSRGRRGLLCGRSLALRLPLLTDERAQPVELRRRLHDPLGDREYPLHPRQLRRLLILLGQQILLTFKQFLRAFADMGLGTQTLTAAFFQSLVLRFAETQHSSVDEGVAEVVRDLPQRLVNGTVGVRHDQHRAAGAHELLADLADRPGLACSRRAPDEGRVSTKRARNRLGLLVVQALDAPLRQLASSRGLAE